MADKMVEINRYLRETHLVGPQVAERIVSPDLCSALRQFGFGLVGLSDVAGSFRFARRNPRFAQLLACLNGSGRVWCGDGWIPCTAGTVYVTPPGVYHAYESVTETAAPWRLCWFQLAPRGDTSSGLSAALASRFTAPQLIHGDPQPLAAAIEGLYREAMGIAAPGLLRLWLEMVLAQADRLLEPEGMDVRLRRVLDAVEAHLDQDWNLADLAGCAGVTEEHLRRLFHRHVGRSPMRYLTQLRMRHAAALLSTESYTVAAVAGNVGYRNDFAFSSAFRRCMGRPPSTFRAES